MDNIRILHVLGSLAMGGAESRIMDLYHFIDRSKVQFDFLTHSQHSDFYEEEVKKLGGRIYKVPRLTWKDPIAYRRNLTFFFAQHHEFAAVHVHMTSTAIFYLDIVQGYHMPLIAHARSAGTESFIKDVCAYIFRIPLRRKADYLFSCSQKAAEIQFGRKLWKEGKVKIIPNAIATENYKFRLDVRNSMRVALGIEDSFVLGHVGSFRLAKNHTFLLKIFQELVKIKGNSRLVLVGDGPLRGEIEEKVRQSGLDDKIIFAGVQGDAMPYYQAFDYFVFPSLYEGFPGSVLEAQICGLRCLISSKITKEVQLTNLVEYLDLDEEPSIWAKAILKKGGYERQSFDQKIAAEGYDAKILSEKMEHFYNTLVKCEGKN